MNTVIRKTTERTEDAENKFSNFSALYGEYFCWTGFGQSRFEVRITHPYNVERQSPLETITKKICLDISKFGFLTGQVKVFQSNQEGVEDTFCLLNYNFNKYLLENGGKYAYKQNTYNPECPSIMDYSGYK